MNITTPHIGRIHDRIEIRPLAETDRAGLVEEFSHLSPETRQRRFGAVASSLSERDLDRLTSVDHRNHEALAAVTPSGRIVGVARYIVTPNDPGSAEVAIEVTDTWQGGGIGRRLMSELVARARAEGIARFVAFVSSDNYPVLSWIEHVGGVATIAVGDATIYTIPLDRLPKLRKAA